MKTYFPFLILLLLIMGFPQTARAEYQEGSIIPAGIIAPLMAWVETQTGVRVPALPTVVASRAQLKEIVSRMGRLAGRAQALYVGGRVVLDHEYFDTEDTTQMSLLVHELVHYAQSFKRGGAWACPQAKEVEAYTLQNKWLEQQGRSPFVRASWIARAAACPATSSSIAVAQAD